MELELSHLMPYLPYGLKCQFTYDGYIGTITSLSDIGEYENIKIRIDYREGEHIWMFKPLLRPMTDKTKIIQYEDGEYMMTDIEDDQTIGGMEYDTFIMYAKNHFDIFGLIDAGLAIDINTLTHE